MRRFLFAEKRALACQGGHGGGAQATQPKDGEIKGREVRRVAVVLFQGVVAHFREVQSFSTPRLYQDFYVISNT